MTCELLGLESYGLGRRISITTLGHGAFQNGVVVLDVGVEV